MTSVKWLKTLGVIVISKCLLPNLLISQNNLYDVIVEGIDTALILMENGKESKSGDLENAIIFASTDSEDKKKWRWSHRGNDNSLTLYHTWFLTRPFLHFSPNNRIGFGTSEPIADFDFKSFSLTPTMEFNSGITKFLEINGGSICSIHNQQFGILELGTNDQVFLTFKSNEVIAEGSVATKNLIKFQEGPDLNSQWWVGVGDNPCASSTKKSLFFANFTNGHTGPVAAISGDNGDFCEVSDSRYKKNIRAFPSILNRIMQLQPYYYRYRKQSVDATPTLGYMAQEVEQIFPETVKYSETDDQYMLSYNPFNVLAIAAFQEQSSEVNDLQNEIARVRTLLSELNRTNISN